MARKDRVAILKIGYTEFVADVATALVLEEHLSDLPQVDARWVDPDDYPDAECTGMVFIPAAHPVKIDVKLKDRDEHIVSDPDWYANLKKVEEEEYS